MVLRSRVAASVFLITLCLCAGDLFAAWWDNTDLPVPSNTSEVKQETRKMIGLEYVFTYYTSGQKMPALKEFYRQKLGQAGWKEQSLKMDLSKLPKIEGLPQIDVNRFADAAESTMAFDNENETLTISFMPPEYSRDGKIKYAICRGRKPKTAADIDMTRTAPELVAEPKKKVYPVFPESYLISLDENDRKLEATYYTKQDIEQAVSFYKNEMSKYDWFLVDEKPIEMMDKNAMNKSADSCPSCAKMYGDKGIAMETWMAELQFKNENKELCRVMVAQVLSETSKANAFGMTTINIRYEKQSK